MTTYLKPFVDSINELLEKGEMECPRLVCTQVIGVSMRKYFTLCAGVESGNNDSTCSA